MQVPWCFSMEVVMMGGGLDKGISINETLIRFPVCFGFKRLLLMQQRDGMWIVHRLKWNLCQLSVSEQGTVDSCQHQHTPRKGKVVRQSSAFILKRMHLSFTPTTLFRLSDRHKDVHPSAHMHRHWRGKDETRKYSRGLVWSGHWMSWLSSCTQFYFDFKISWAAFEKTSACSFGQMMTCSFFRYFTDLCLLVITSLVSAPLRWLRLQFNSPTIKLKLKTMQYKKDWFPIFKPSAFWFSLVLKSSLLSLIICRPQYSFTTWIKCCLFNSSIPVNKAYILQITNLDSMSSSCLVIRLPHLTWSRTLDSLSYFNSNTYNCTHMLCIKGA